MIYNLLKLITSKRGELFPAEGFLYGILFLFPNNIEYWKEINMVVNATKVLRTEYKTVTILRNNLHLLGTEPIQYTYVHFLKNKFKRKKKHRYFRFCQKLPMGNYIQKKQYTQFKTVNILINYFNLLRTGPVLFSFLKKMDKFRRKYEQSFFEKRN